ILLFSISLYAQGTNDSNSEVAALTPDQQPAANSALCSALSKVVWSPSSATAATLVEPAVLSVASSAFANSTHLPLGAATGMLKGYASQHAKDILASCAVSNATKGLSSELPTSNVPSMPKMP